MAKLDKYISEINQLKDEIKLLEKNTSILYTSQNILKKIAVKSLIEYKQKHNLKLGLERNDYIIKTYKSLTLEQLKTKENYNLAVREKNEGRATVLETYLKIVENRLNTFKNDNYAKLKFYSKLENDAYLLIGIHERSSKMFNLYNSKYAESYLQIEKTATKLNKLEKKCKTSITNIDYKNKIDYNLINPDIVDILVETNLVLKESSNSLKDDYNLNNLPSIAETSKKTTQEFNFSL